MINGEILAHYRCNLLTLFLLVKLTTIHFYVDGLCLFGSFQCLDDFFLDRDHACHDLCQAVSQLVRFLGRDNDLSLALLSQGPDPAYEVFYGSSLYLGIF